MFHERRSHSYVKCRIAKRYYICARLVLIGLDEFRCVSYHPAAGAMIFDPVYISEFRHTNTLPGSRPTNVQLLFDGFRQFSTASGFEVCIAHMKNCQERNNSINWYLTDSICSILVLSIRTLDINNLHEV